MKALKIVAGLLVVILALLVVVANFSTVESRFECNGTLIANGAKKPDTVFFKLEKYRWWVGLWSDSAGSAWVELPNRTVSYFGDVREAGDFLQLGDSPGKLKGNFSTLSKTIGLELGGFGVFDGTCKDIHR